MSWQNNTDVIVFIGVLVDLHEPVSWIGKTDRKSTPSCGPLNLHAYQQLVAVTWAVEIINNKSWSGEFALGIQNFSLFLNIGQMMYSCCTNMLH
jgi:hypothetical protein